IGPFVHLAVGVSLNLLLLVLHYISRKNMSVIQIISVVVKTIPIIAVVLFGFIFLNEHTIIFDDNHKQIDKINMFESNKKPSFNGIILAIPMILFAYDAFTSAATVQNKIKDGEKKLPFLIIVTMLIVMTLYISLTIVQMLRGTGTMENTIKDIFPPSVATPLSFVLLLLITISVVGALNGFIYMFRNNLENIMNDGNMFVPKWMGKNNKKNSVVYATSFILLMSLLSLIYGLCISGNLSESGRFINVLSDSLPVFAFFIYSLVIMFYWVKRKRKKHMKINNVGFYVVASVAIGLIMPLMIYEMVYIINLKPIIDGEFSEIKNYTLFIGFWLTIIISLSMWHINKRLNKKRI
ncbi:MAG: APC family permease, partial [Mycoplasmataceae bacterium]|nr:APC family permease [Mycoplasmataceae bacterium]